MDLDDEELRATREMYFGKQKTADEMFEKLGYKKDGNTYIDRLENEIYFEKDNYGKVTIRFYENPDSSQIISMKELQAINQKCKELGWLE